MRVRELLTTWTFDVESDSLNKMDRKIKDVKGSASGLGTRMKSVADGMVSSGLRLTAFVTVPILGMGAAMLKAASDSEESEAKFATVFQDVGKEANAVSKNLRDNFGLSSNAARELLGNTGDLLTGFGFTGKASLDLAKGVNELAVDLASFTNFAGGAEGASAALTKALLGERESVKALGISILETDVKAKVAALRASGRLTNETERQAKAIATLEIALEQSKNAIGDFARTQDGLANATRVMRGRIGDMAVSFGKILIPFALKAVAVITRLSIKFESLSKDTKEWILIAAGVLAVLPPMILLVGLVASGIFVLGGAFTILKTVMLAVRAASLATILVWAAIPLLFIAIGVGVGLLLQDLWKFATGGKSAIGELITRFTGAKVSMKEITDSIGSGLKSVLDWFVKLGQIEIAIFNVAVNAIKLAFSDITELVNGGDSAIGEWLGTLGGFGDLVKGSIDIATKSISAFIDLVKKGVGLLNQFGGFLGREAFDLFNGEDKTKAPDKKAPEKTFLESIADVGRSTTEFFNRDKNATPTPLVDQITGLAPNNTGGVNPIRPLDQIINPRTTTPLQASTNTVNNANTVNATVNMTLPEGTSEEQQQEISKMVNKSIGDAMDRSNRDALNEQAAVS